MNKIEKLIAGLCPDAVSHISLGEITNECKERNKTQSISEVRSVTNSAGLVSTDDYFENTRTSQDTSNYKIVHQGMFVYNPSRINVGSIAQHKETITVIVSPMYVVVGIDKSKLIPEYLELFLSSRRGKFQILSKVEVGARFRLSYKAFSLIKLPLPPLAIQQEIVKILGTFTTLKAEMAAELEARKKQYEYYRDGLLTFGDEVEWKKLETLCVIGDGLHGTPKYNDLGGYYFINGNNLSAGKINFDSKTKKVDDITYEKYGITFTVEDTVLMSINGTIGNVSLFSKEKIVLGKSVAYFNITSENLQKKYLFYFLQTNYAKKYYKAKQTGATIKNLGLKALRQFQIPIPSLPEQERIVAILDKFDALVNDISVGLPAELNARRKQYEYYRDQLLPFKPLRKEDAK